MRPVRALLTPQQIKIDTAPETTKAPSSVVTFLKQAAKGAAVLGVALALVSFLEQQDWTTILHRTQGPSVFLHCTDLQISRSDVVCALPPRNSLHLLPHQTTRPATSMHACMHSHHSTPPVVCMHTWTGCKLRL